MSVHRIELVPEALAVVQVQELVQVQVVVVEQMELELVVVALVVRRVSMVILNT